MDRQQNAFLNFIDRYTGKDQAIEYIDARLDSANIQIERAEETLSHTETDLQGALSDLQEAVRDAAGQDNLTFDVDKPDFDPTALKDVEAPAAPDTSNVSSEMPAFEPDKWEASTYDAPEKPAINEVDTSGFNNLTPPAQTFLASAPSDVLGYVKEGEFVADFIDTMKDNIATMVDRSLNATPFTFTPALSSGGSLSQMPNIEPLFQSLVLADWLNSNGSGASEVEIAQDDLSPVDFDVDVDVDVPELLECADENLDIDTPGLEGYDGSECSDFVIPDGTIVNPTVNVDITTIDPALEAAAYARARSRAANEYALAVAGAEAAIQARGFSLPPGALSATIAKAANDFGAHMTDTNRDITVSRVQMEQKRTEYELTKAAQTTDAEFKHDSILNDQARIIADITSKWLSLQNARDELLMREADLELKIAESDRALEETRNKLNLDRSRVQLGVKELELKAETSEEELTAKHNELLNARSKLQIEKAELALRAYAQEMDAQYKYYSLLNAQDELRLKDMGVELQKIQHLTDAQFKFDGHTLDAERVRVEAQAAIDKTVAMLSDSAVRLDDLAAKIYMQEEQLKFDAAKTEFTAAWEAYNNKVKNYKVLMEAYQIDFNIVAAKVRADSEYNQFLVGLYSSEVSIYTKQMEQENVKLEGEKIEMEKAWKPIQVAIEKSRSENEKLLTIVKMYESEVRAYAAKIEGLRTAETLDLTRYEIETKGKSTEVLANLEIAKLEVDAAMKAIIARMDYLKEQTRLSTGIVSSALNAMNTSASFGYSGGNSRSVSSSTGRSLSVGYSYSGLAEDVSSPKTDI